MSNPNIFYLYETVVGLGHQRRASGIVNGLVAAGFHVSVASGSFVGAENYFHPLAQLVQLPANRRSIDGVTAYYDENNRLVEDPTYDRSAWNAERINAVRTIAEAKRIDAMMIEWWPFSRRQHFDSIVNVMLDIQQAKFHHTPLLLSSVRDDPKPGWSKKPSDRLASEQAIVTTINDRVDAVLIHGDPKLVRFEDGFSLHKSIQKPLIYTGYVVNDAAKLHRAGDRDRTVIVSAGSGDEGHHLLKAALRAMPHTRHLRDHEWHLIMGPRMDPVHREEVAVAVERTPHKRQTHVHLEMTELPAVLGRSGFSISYSGYNTTMEVMTSGVPSVLVPKFAVQDSGRIRMDLEQWERLLKLRKKGLAAIAGPKHAMDAIRFANTLDNAYLQASHNFTLDTDGAAKTAVEVARLVMERRMSRSAFVVPTVTDEPAITIGPLSPAAPMGPPRPDAPNLSPPYNQAII